MIDDILSETVVLVSHDIALGATTTQTRRIVDVEREQMGPDAEDMSDGEISQIILDRRLAAQEAAADAEDAYRQIAQARAALVAFDIGALDAAIGAVNEEAARAALTTIRDLIAAVAVLVR